MSDILIEKQRHTTIFTLNKPERMNSLSASMLAALAEGIRDFESDPDQYVAIITGAGDKAFCAGGDLKEMASNAADGSRLPLSRNPDIAGIAACDKVTIAAVNGLAVAGGLEVAISCDIRIAADNAWFGVFEVKHGIIAGVAANVLPRLMPIGAVMDLMLSGDRLTAELAHQWGLVQRVVTRDRLLETAIAKADMIAQNSQAAVWGTKQVIKSWRNASMAEQQRYYEAVQHRVLLSGDVFEGPRAFAEKRRPAYRNGWPTPTNPPMEAIRDDKTVTA
ncbi:MAG: enoyl-CoA hydratase [Mycobacterium sp.]|nr:enoyl-CoA hydratase [Mycobacterium sp.]